MSERTGAPWLTIQEVADLLHITERVALKNATSGRYGEIKRQAGHGVGQGGTVILVSLHGLPANAQIEYYEREVPAKNREIGAGLDALSGRGRQTVLERLAVLHGWRRFLAAHEGKKGDLTRQYLATLPERLHPATLYRWHEMYRSGGAAALAPCYGERSKRKDREKKITKRLEAEFKALYLDENQPTIAECYKKLKHKAEAEGWPEAANFPCERTFARLASSIPLNVLTLRREGEKVYKDKCEPSMLRDYTSLKSNDIWVGDHHQFDVAVLGPDGKVCFPWLTAWMDVRSRNLRGWHISLNPNSDTVLLAFHHAVERSDHNLPWKIYIDNGKDYRCVDIAGGRKSVRVTLDPARITPVMSLLEIGVTYSKPYNAQAKPIERTFRTVKEQFSRLFISYRGGNVLERPERLADVLKNPEGLITIDEFKKRFAEWVDAEYNENCHSGQGMDGRCPREVYNSLLTAVRRAAPEALRQALMRTTKPLTVQKHGIWLFDRWFRSDTLMMRQGEKVHARYHPDKIGILYVYDLQDKFICQVESKDLVAWGATAEDQRAAEAEKKRLRKQAEQYFAGRSAVAAEPDHAKRVIDRRRKVAQAQQPQDKPNPVIEPVRIPLQLPKKQRAQAVSEPVVDIAAMQRAKEAAQKAAKEAERLKQEEQERLILSRINAKA